MYLRYALALFLPLSLTPAKAAGQIRTQTLDQIKRAGVIRVQVGPTLLSGRYLGRSAEFFSVDTGHESHSIHLDQVDRLWERGRATKTGALVGGVFGAIGTALFFGRLIGAVCETDDCETGKAIVIGGVLGGAGGLLVGGAIGAAIPVWRQRYP